jgi:hypothetical protein
MERGDKEDTTTPVWGDSLGVAQQFWFVAAAHPRIETSAGVAEGLTYLKAEKRDRHQTNSHSHSTCFASIPTFTLNILRWILSALIEYPIKDTTSPP